jgi:hypothetical protein
LVTAYVTTTLGGTMAIVKHSTIENDVVKLLVPVGDWPAGTIGTAVSIYDDAALVEVSDDRTGEGLDMFLVPAESLERQPCAWLRA